MFLRQECFTSDSFALYESTWSLRRLSYFLEWLLLGLTLETAYLVASKRHMPLSRARRERRQQQRLQINEFFRPYALRKGMALILHLKRYYRKCNWINNLEWFTSASNLCAERCIILRFKYTRKWYYKWYEGKYNWYSLQIIIYNTHPII